MSLVIFVTTSVTMQGSSTARNSVEVVFCFFFVCIKLLGNVVRVDGFGSAVFTSEVCFLLDAFLPGSYFLPLTVRWSFFSATAKSLTTCNCVHLELKSFFLIKKCAAPAKHLVGSLKSILANFGWKGHGSIKLQQFSSAISSGVSLSFSNLSSVGADKCGGIFN